MLEFLPLSFQQIKTASNCKNLGNFNLISQLYNNSEIIRVSDAYENE